MNVICLEEQAFYALIEEVIRRVKPKFIQSEKWIPTEEAMKRLGITSKTTLQKYRDEGRIRYSLVISSRVRPIFTDSGYLSLVLPLPKG